LSLGIGEGGEGLGTERTAGTGSDRIKKRIPRNAPGLWNLGAKEIDVLFHDGRLSVSDAFPSGFNSPGAVHDRIDAAWPILAKRVRVTGDYGPRFVEAFDHIEVAEDVSIVEIANALAAFMGTEWQSFDSPYDAFLTGDDTALNADAKAGMALFFGIRSFAMWVEWGKVTRWRMLIGFELRPCEMSR